MITIMESEDNTEFQNVSNESRMKSAREKHFGSTKKRGRKSLHEIYLNSIPIINFIKQP